MIKFWKFLSVSIVVAVCLGLLLVPATPTSLPSTVSANPAELTAGIEIHASEAKVGFDENFTVTVTINNTANEAINTVGAFINFSPDLISVTADIALNSVWTMPTAYTYDNTKGTIDLAGGILAAGGTTASIIPVATINMKSNSSKSGIADINLIYVTGRESMVLNTPQADDILNWSYVVNGTVKVGKPTLTVNVTPAGCGNVTINNTITPSFYPSNTTWEWDQVVKLEAVDPALGYTFDHWSGDPVAATNPTNITMDDSPKSVTANFVGEPPPEISAVPSSLNFSATERGANPPNQILGICNSGGYTLNWTANITDGSVTWLSMSPRSGGNLSVAECNSTDVAVNITGLTAGTYNANINITAPGASNSPLQVPVTLNVAAISVSPTNLTFVTSEGKNPPNQTLEIWNSGNGTLNWNVTDNAAWLDESPTSGSSTGEHDNVTVSVDVTGLTGGTYNATINITGGSTVGVPVTLYISAISVSPVPLTFTTTEGENPPDKTLEVCNWGTGTLNWSLSDNAAWLSESPTSGSLDEDECEDVTVSVDVTGMSAGDYSATITITGSDEVSVPVSLHIESAMEAMPVLPAGLSASALSITPQQVQPGQEVTISINVANTGGETGSYNAILYINSVVEDSQSVSVAAGTSKNVIFTVSKSQAGVYDVSLAGQSGQFEVVGGGWFGAGLGTGGIIAIVVVVIVLIVAVVFILRGTTRPE